MLPLSIQSFTEDISLSFAVPELLTFRAVKTRLDTPLFILKLNTVSLSEPQYSVFAEISLFLITLKTGDSLTKEKTASDLSYPEIDGELC